MRLFLLCFFSVLSFGFLNSCEDNGVESELQPGRRDYEWTVDTLKIPFTTLHRIWGSAPDDVWAVGPGGDLDKTIYHFNGTTWENDEISRGISPRCVWGFGKNNVWIAGGDGKIWHFNGLEWKESVEFEKPQDQIIYFSELWGDSPNNLFACGSSGFEEKRYSILSYYNGANWKLIEFTNIRSYHFLRMRGTSDRYYVFGLGENGNGEDKTAIFEYKKENSIKTIYEKTYSSQTRSFVQKINNEIYFVIGNKINKYINDEIKLIVEISNQNFGLQIYGRHDKDILLRMEDGIAHYNGTDIEYLYRIGTGILIGDVFVFEKDIFVLATDYNNGTNLIFRGKLK